MEDMSIGRRTTRRKFLKTVGATSLMAFVASVLAVGCSSGSSSGGATGTAAPAESSGPVSVTESTPGSTPISKLLSVDPSVLAKQCGTEGVVVTIPDWKLEMNTTSVPAGKVHFVLNVTGWSMHQLHIVGNGVDKLGPQVQVGKCGSFDVDLKPGTYEIYCDIDHHRERGEKGTLTVK